MDPLVERRERWRRVIFCPTGCHRAHNGLIPGSHRSLNVDPPPHTGYIPATYRLLIGLLTFKRSLNDLLPFHRPQDVSMPACCRVFTLHPFRNRARHRDSILYCIKTTKMHGQSFIPALPRDSRHHGVSWEASEHVYVGPFPTWTRQAKSRPGVLRPTAAKTDSPRPTEKMCL